MAYSHVMLYVVIHVYLDYFGKYFKDKRRLASYLQQALCCIWLCATPSLQPASIFTVAQ